jgi:PilZ domain
MKQRHDRFVLRKYARLPIRVPLFYVGKDLVGQGVLRELSRGGCQILGNYPVTPGETLGLRILHPLHPDPLFFGEVRVRWVKGFEFGVAFRVLHEGDAERLDQVLDDFLNSRSYSELCVPS